MLNTIATGTVCAIWFLGALCALLGVGLLLSHLAWKCLIQIKGWRTVRKALVQYHKAQDLNG